LCYYSLVQNGRKTVVVWYSLVQFCALKRLFIFMLLFNYSTCLMLSFNYYDGYNDDNDDDDDDDDDVGL